MITLLYNLMQHNGVCLLQPPPFYSSTGNVVVSIAGNTAAQSFLASSFALQFVCILQNTNDAVVSGNENNLNFEMNLLMGYGTIVPPLVGGQSLVKTTTMKWMLAPQEMILPSKRLTGPLIISLANFNIPKNTDGTCLAILTIYSTSSSASPVLFSGCREPKKWIIVDSQQSLIVYEVNHNKNIVNAGRFQLTWYVDSSLFGCGEIFYPNFVTDSSMVISDGSQSSLTMRRHEYGSWVIQPENGGQVKLQIDWINMAIGSSVLVYDGPNTSGKH